MSTSTGGVRFQDPTLGNASPWIYVWNMWSLSASTGFIVLRLWSRRKAPGLDDLLNTLAFAVAVASSGTIFAALSQGLGSPDGIRNQSKCSSVASIVVTSICLLFVTDFLSKCSTLFLIRRVITHGASPDKIKRLACDVVLGACAVWVVVAIGLLSSQCTTHCSLGTGGVCASGHRVHAIIAVSIFLELAIFALPCWLFYRLQMATVHKVTTVGLFALRFPLIAFSSVYMATFATYIRSVDAGSADIGPGIYWQLVLLACVVIAPCLQALKRSAELFNTSGAQVTNSSARGSDYRLQDLSGNSATRSRKMSRQMSTTLSRHISKKAVQKSESNTELRGASEAAAATARNNSASRERMAWAQGWGRGFRSTTAPKMVIRQQTDVDVVVHED